MSPQSDPPQPSMEPRGAQAMRPRPLVSRRPAAASTAEETSPAPLGFEALLKEINTVVELLERIDVALDQQFADSPAAVMADDAPVQHPNLQN